LEFGGIKGVTSNQAPSEEMDGGWWMVVLWLVFESEKSDEMAKNSSELPRGRHLSQQE